MSLKSIERELDGCDTENKTQRPQSDIHVRIQQRNGRKCWTLIEGLAEDLDLKKILRALKKEFQTNGTVLDTDTHGKVIQLQGDHRERVKQFFTRYKIWEEDIDPPMKIHGF